MPAPVPWYPQETEWSCTVACLRMVMAYWGVETDETTLRACCRTTVSGTRADDAVDCVRQHGFIAEHRRFGEVDALARWLDAGLIPIVLLNLFPIDAFWCMHAVVVIGVDQEAVTFLDPARGERSTSRPAFEQAWQMNLGRALIVALVEVNAVETANE